MLNNITLYITLQDTGRKMLLWSRVELLIEYLPTSSTHD